MDHARLGAVTDLTPAYSTLLVHLDPSALGIGQASVVERAVRRVLDARGAQASSLGPPRSVEIPVCYDASCGPDLADVAALHRLTPEALVRLHSEATYTVRFLGFSPGFPYLAGLPQKLVTPRLPTPRMRVPAGSVAIAGDQAGIYPRETAGGWRILGRTPITIFDPAATEPAALRPGDQVRFVPISPAELAARSTPGGPR